MGRLRRILVNTSLQRDLAALHEMQGLLRRSATTSGDVRRIRDLAVRQVAISHQFFQGSQDSALSPRPDMLERLFDAGEQAAAALIAQDEAAAANLAVTAGGA